MESIRHAFRCVKLLRTTGAAWGAALSYLPVGHDVAVVQPLWIFADQLGPHVWDAPEHREREIIIVESRLAFGRRRYHRQKQHLVLSAMRHLRDELGDRVRYYRADSYREALEELAEPVVVHEPTSHAAERFVHALRADGLVDEVLPTPTFALSRADFRSWAADRDRFRMEDFYRAQRRRFDVLLEPDGEPVSGRWNLDAENREPPPKGVRRLDVEPPWWPVEDEIDAGVRTDLDSWAVPSVGVDGPRRFAVTRSEAELALAHFVEHRLSSFGPYEDAMLEDDWTMAHSLLSFPLNLGLLEPLEVVRAAEHAHRSGRVALAAAEGFIRQVLGWREYVWHLYWHFGADYRRRDPHGAHGDLPSWWTALAADDVEAVCLRTALGGVHDRGWTHHIQRLMILGNHALQRGYDADALTEWFQTTYVDGFDWVMPVNVIGMSQHADGGLMATKPYASGGAYINRMSDYCGSCVYDPKKRLGDNACPFTAGYWAWVHRNSETLEANSRTARAVHQMRRLGDIDAVVEQERGRSQY